MEGFLLKRGRGESGSFFSSKGVKKRWFVLEGYFLTYYESFDRKKNSPVNKKGVIPVKDCECKKYTEKEKGLTWSFSITHDERKPMYLIAETEALMNTWLKVLLKSSKGLLGRSKVDFSEYYLLMGFDQDAILDESIIRKQFRKLSLKAHPDKGGDEKNFQRLQEAMGILLTKVEEDELAKQYHDVIFEAHILKGGPGVGFGMTIFEDSKTGHILVSDALPSMQLQYLSDPAIGNIQKGDRFVGIGDDEITDWTIDRVKQRLGDFRVPVNTVLSIRFLRKVLVGEAGDAGAGPEAEVDDKSDVPPTYESRQVTPLIQADNAVAIRRASAANLSLLLGNTTILSDDANFTDYSAPTTTVPFSKITSNISTTLVPPISYPNSSSQSVGSGSSTTTAKMRALSPAEISAKARRSSINMSISPVASSTPDGIDRVAFYSLQADNDALNARVQELESLLQNSPGEEEIEALKISLDSVLQENQQMKEEIEALTNAKSEAVVEQLFPLGSPIDEDRLSDASAAFSRLAQLLTDESGDLDSPSKDIPASVQPFLIMSGIDSSSLKGSAISAIARINVVPDSLNEFLADRGRLLMESIDRLDKCLDSKEQEIGQDISKDKSFGLSTPSKGRSAANFLRVNTAFPSSKEINSATPSKSPTLNLKKLTRLMQGLPTVKKSQR